jgi:hypothetical protein
LGTPYNDILAQRAAAVALPDRMTGSSGYFSSPTRDLDPRLFAPGSDVLMPEVRRWVLAKLYTYWDRIYQHPQWWSTVWIAGSGITYQWSGGRGVGDQPGDLDVLIGVDWPVFFKSNPQWAGTSDAEMAGFMNEEFHRELWPLTANAVLPMGGAPFEVTFYVNPEATDIRSINPYAAYNVTTNEWTVRPPQLGETPNLDVPQSWLDQVDYEVGRARELGSRYNELRTRLMANNDVPSQLNALTALHEVIGSASNLFAQIHSRRKLAFSEGGNGYADFTNWAWQRHKLLGSGAVLHTLAQIDNDVHSDSVGQCYANGLLDPQHALMLATRVVAREA